MLVLNDVHIGVERRGGTTPKTQEALRNYLFTSFEEKLMDCTSDLLILGDLFDQFEVSPRDWIQTYLILQDWLVRTPRTLYLVAGNHDHSPKALRVSSFEMLCKVLVEQFGPERVVVVAIDEWKFIGSQDPSTAKTIALAHCSNQDIFNLKLAEVLQASGSGTRVLLHANFDNNFAVESDHSLNVSRDQVKEFQGFGATLFFAHEHQARTEMGGSVVVFGNQWPTSIADCLNNDEKFAHVLSGSVEKIRTWTRDINEELSPSGIRGFAETDWRELANVDPQGALFIRVVGNASANEAAEVISAISKFRLTSEAFVISNVVKIDGIVQAEELPTAFEVTKKFDVMEFINKHLEPDEVEAVKKLLVEEAVA